MSNFSFDYRTKEQFDEICDNLLNDNFNQAVAQVLEYGFYANDLKKMLADTEWVTKSKRSFEFAIDFYKVIEAATISRNFKTSAPLSSTWSQDCVEFKQGFIES